MTFKDIFAGISSASTATALYGLMSPFINSTVLNVGAIGLSIFIGYSISFYIQRQLEEHEKFSFMIIISLLLSATYTTNSKYLVSIVNSDVNNKIFTDENRVLKDSNLYQKNLIILKQGDYDNKLRKKTSLANKLDELKNLDTQYRLEYTNELEAFRKEYTETPNKRFRKWWKEVGKISGCYTIYNKPKRIECVALYRAKSYRENKVLISSLILSIEEVKKQLKSLSSIMDDNDRIKKGVHEQVSKRYEDKKINEDNVKIVLFLVGFFFEGILLFELWLRLGRRKKEAMNSMKLANVDKVFNDSTKKELIEITPFDIINMYQKNKDNLKNPIRSYLVRGGKGSKRYRALPNALVGAFYYSYTYDIPLKEVTQANILYVNGKKNGKNISDTFTIGTTVYNTLGSTSNHTTYKGNNINPQKVALAYISKNNISENISLDSFFAVINDYMNTIEDYL